MATTRRSPDGAAPKRRRLPLHHGPDDHVHHVHHVHPLGPTDDGTVVMEIGGDTGGLVVYADAGHLGVEVDVFPRGAATPLTHTAIRERHALHGVRYAGVYPGLPAGDYTVAAVGAHPPVDVTVVGGRVVEIHTEGPPP